MAPQPVCAAPARPSPSPGPSLAAAARLRLQLGQAVEGLDQGVHALARQRLGGGAKVRPSLLLSHAWPAAPAQDGAAHLRHLRTGRRWAPSLGCPAAPVRDAYCRTPG
jgi:hypothetical protein